jgi:parallel beta-helix repeat protein
MYLVYDCYALIKNCTFSGCSVGIRVREASKARIQNNRFLSCRRGVELSHTGIADLGGGSLGSEGGNYFSVIAYAFYDGRSAYAGSSYAKGNTWDNPQPSGTVEGPVDNPLNYFIENEGNSIIFSD